MVGESENLSSDNLIKPKFWPLSMGPEKKKDTILNGVVRHILTAVGGALVSKGIVAQTELEMAVGAVVTLIGVVWSAVAKRRSK